MIALFWLLVVANAVGLGTLAVGWVAVPVVTLASGVAAPQGAKGLLSIPIGAGLGWLVLLARSARADGFDRLLALIGQLVPVPVVGLVAVTVVFAMLLGLGGALLGGAIRR